MKEYLDSKCYLCDKSLNLKDVDFIAEQSGIRFNCYDKDKYIIRCNNCGLIMLVPVWTEEELDNIYKHYHQQKDFIGQKDKKKIYFKYIDKYLNKRTNILEVGCGKGHNIERLRNKGYFIIGIDKDEDVCNNITVFRGDIKNINKNWLPNTFDVIYGMHFLEHLQEPIEFINNCYKVLDNKGKLILELPNVDDPLLTVHKNKNFFKYYWRPDHVFFYNKNTLNKLLKKTLFKKFKIKLIQRYGIFNHLNWLLRNKPTNHNIYIPLLDNIYKWFLCNVFRKSDTLLVILEKEK